MCTYADTTPAGRLQGRERMHGVGCLLRITGARRPAAHATPAAVLLYIRVGDAEGAGSACMCTQVGLGTARHARTIATGVHVEMHRRHGALRHGCDAVRKGWSRRALTVQGTGLSLPCGRQGPEAAPPRTSLGRHVEGAPDLDVLAHFGRNLHDRVAHPLARRQPRRKQLQVQQGGGGVCGGGGEEPGERQCAHQSAGTCAAPRKPC